MNIDKRFIINRQGKDFVLFAGLLDAAHGAGLVGIETEAVSVNANIAVFKATATFKDGRSFSSHGDATPENVGRTIAPHFVRMGETRAKARALRDALNIGAASLEELGDDDEPPARQPTPIRQPAPPPAPAPQPTPAAEPHTLAEWWDKAKAAQDALRSIGVKPPMLPPDDADEAELASFVADCRGIYAAKKQKAAR